MKKIILGSLIWVVLFAAYASAAPRLTGHPKVLISQDESVTVTWDDGAGGVYSQACSVHYGTSPLNYTGTIPQSSAGMAQFTPQSAGLSGGVYYCKVVNNAVPSNSSREFKIYVETSGSISYIYPGINAAIPELNPNFSWHPSPGIPYYTLMAFENQPVVEAGSGLTITANIIYAATTDATGIVYAATDPSGYFSKMSPPPLAQGITYSWTVLKNYTGSPAMLAGDINDFSGFRNFRITTPASVGAPSLVSPPDGVTRTPSDGPITLDWNASVPAANIYKAELMKREEGGLAMTGNITVPVWTAYTNNTQITIPSNIALNNSSYRWQVYAIDGAGRAVKSEARNFFYGTVTFAVDITVREIDELNNYVTVPEVTTFIETLSGGNVNIYPFVSNETGDFFYNLPAGDYRFVLKKEGYETAYYDISSLSSNFSDTWTITRSAYAILGRVIDNASNPVQGAVVTGTYPGSTFTASANTLFDGSFLLYMGRDTGNVNLLVAKPGYQAGSATVSIPAITPPHTHGISDIVINKNSNVLSGKVTNSLGQGIFNAMITIQDTSDPVNSAVVYTDSSGNYSANPADGSYVVSVSRAGFVAPSPASVSFSLGESKVRDFTMQMQANIIEGYVTSASSAPLSGALVSAVPLSGPAVQAHSNAMGYYMINVGAGTFTVNASLPGYNSGGAQVKVFASGGQTQQGNFIMTPNPSAVADSTLNINVKAGAVNLAGVNVLISGTSGNALGHSMNGMTDGSGNVSFGNIFDGNYAVNLTKNGYNPLTSPVVVPASSVVQVNLVMTAAAVPAGAIQVLCTTGTSGVAGVMVRIFEASLPDTAIATGSTNGAGHYTASGLAPGNYVVRASLAGHTVSPQSAYASVSSGATQNVTVIMTQVSPAFVQVFPPAGIIYNDNRGGPYLFTAALKDAGGNDIPASFSWSVVPAQAGQIGISGILTPTADYIGAVAVYASAHGVSGAAEALVYQYLTSASSAKTVRDYEGFSLAIPANAASSSNTIDRITLEKRAATGAKAVASGKKVLGRIHDLTDGFVFSTPVTLTLRVPDGNSSTGAKIGRWNNSSLKWEPVAGTTGVNSVSALISDFSEYSIVSDLKALDIEYLSARPNPFSPYRGGLNITYGAVSDRAASVKMTIKIYNVAGKLVRTLVEGELRNIGVPTVDVWDGRDNDGKLARNGRYIIEAVAEDSTGKKSRIFPIVMVK